MWSNKIGDEAKKWEERVRTRNQQPEQIRMKKLKDEGEIYLLMNHSRL